MKYINFFNLKCLKKSILFKNHCYNYQSNFYNINKFNLSNKLIQKRNTKYLNSISKYATELDIIIKGNLNSKKENRFVSYLSMAAFFITGLYLAKQKRYKKKADENDTFNSFIGSDGILIPNIISGSLQDLIEYYSDELFSLNWKPSFKMKFTNNFSLNDDFLGKEDEVLTPKPEDLQRELLQQQIFFQKEIEKLELENRDLRRHLMLKDKTKFQKNIKKSLIDKYSDVLDCLSEYDTAYRVQDQLPRVVVIGDQSSGKTSVLEMIVQARIFPRGSGEMMTRSPVQVTLSEGPYHSAKFKDQTNEYDITKESELEALRKEIERRMKESISEGQTVSSEVIALNVKGPGLQRMVLVDLPGIISTVTTGMASNTKDDIVSMCQQHMANPNSIILCIQDGSLDAERSNVTDLVSSIDPSGKRTIFVLTKVDLAEANLTNPKRIKDIMEGKLFPMKALSYFAVVAGKGNSSDSIQKIMEHEEKFFKGSKLFKGGILRTHQMGSLNLSFAVSQCFWKMVRESVQQQADAFKAAKFNLETEWKNTFPKLRELDREELYEKLRGQILDSLNNLSHIPAQYWDNVILNLLWMETSNYLFEQIYLPAAQAPNAGLFNTLVDIKLKQWMENYLPSKCYEIAKNTLEKEFSKLIFSDKKQPSSSSSVKNAETFTNPFSPQFVHVQNLLTNIHERNRTEMTGNNNTLQNNNSIDDDPIFDELKRAIVDECHRRNNGSNAGTGYKNDNVTINNDDRAMSVNRDNLRVIQNNRLEDRSVRDKQQWDQAVSFMKNIVLDKLEQGERILDEMLGPSLWQRWTHWQYLTEDQRNRNFVKQQLDKMLMRNIDGEIQPKAKLSQEELITVRKNLEAQNLAIEDKFIEETWHRLYRVNFFQQALITANNCLKGFYYYQQELHDNTVDCSDVILFWRIERMLDVTSKTLRQQIINYDIRILEQIIRQVLDDMAEDKGKLKLLLKGKRVDLADEIKRVRLVLDLLEDFVQDLNKEKP